MRKIDFLGKHKFKKRSAHLENPKAQRPGRTKESTLFMKKSHKWIHSDDPCFIDVTSPFSFPSPETNADAGAAKLKDVTSNKEYDIECKLLEKGL